MKINFKKIWNQSLSAGLVLLIILIAFNFIYPKIVNRGSSFQFKHDLPLVVEAIQGRKISYYEYGDRESSPSETWYEVPKWFQRKYQCDLLLKPGNKHKGTENSAYYNAIVSFRTKLHIGVLALLIALTIIPRFKMKKEKTELEKLQEENKKLRNKIKKLEAAKE